MMKKDFLLNTELARRLYQSCAALPVIDYHNHLPISDIKGNRRFHNLYKLWVQPDPYKHRAMRMCGVPERCITGDAAEEEKFACWCGIFPKLAGSPLFQWSLMELEDVLEIREVPGKDNWKLIWEHGIGYMERNIISTVSILDRYRVEYASPCASLTDDLAVYGEGGRVTASLRGDTVLLPRREDIQMLEKQTGVTVSNLEDYFQAISLRLDAFRAAGCRFADHSLDNGFRYCREDGRNQERFVRLLEEVDSLREADKAMLSSAVLRHLACEYAQRDMTLQLHMGAQRRTSTRLRKCAGAAGGYAAMGNSVDVRSLTEFLDDVEQQSGMGLPKIILFALNPADHGMLACLAGSYSRDGVPGLVTQGPAWWWCDHSHGIRSVLDHTAVYGLLSNFPGMTTDSRSFLSFIRHDYFRRVLCDWMAERVLRQDMPKSPELLETLLYDICYGNAKSMINKSYWDESGR